MGSEETAESESRVDRMSRLSAPPEICVRRLESRHGLTVTPPARPHSTVQGWVACSVEFLSGNACTVLARCTRLALSMDLKDPERSACEVRAVPSP